MDKQAIWDEVRLSLRRAARSDFLEMSATDAERAALAKSEPPLTEEVTQNYAAWRRSVLYASVLILTLGTIFTFVSYESAEDQFARGLVVLAKQAGRFIGVTEARGMVRQYYGVDNLEKLDLIPQAAGLANIAVLILLLLGSRHWARLRKSRRLVRSAWYVLVAVPLLLAIYPWARDLDFRHVPQESVGTFKTTFATAFGMMIFFLLAPRLVAVFSGFLRASITLKTLFYESAVPGYMTVMIAPIYAIVALIVFTLLNQLQGNFLLMTGIGCIIAGAVVYMWRARDLLKSHTRDEAKTLVRGIRTKSLVFNLIGLVLIGVFLLRMEGVSFFQVAEFLLLAIGNILLLVVVGADFVVALLHKEYQQSKSFQRSPFAAEFEAKMAAFTAAGLGELRAKAEPVTDADAEHPKSEDSSS